MTFELRDYQREAVDATYEYLKDQRGDAPIIVAPTGAGKSLMLAQMIQDMLGWGGRVMLVSHVKELLEQNSEALLKLMPDADVGFFSAGLGRKDTEQRIIFAGIQSVYKHAPRFVPAPDLLIIDEAHLVSPDEETRYGQFLTDMRQCNPRMKIVGLTATPYRLSSGRLDQGDGAMFSGISYDISVSRLMDDGWLAPLVSRGSEHHIDLTHVGRRGGEFIESQLAMAASDPALVRATAEEIATLGVERKSWLVFCSGVSHAEMMLGAIREAAPVRAEMITGDTPKDERKALLAAFKAGEIRCLVNCNVLTTGFDAPGTDLVALVRATASTSLYVQMAGRGTRTAHGKTDCLLLDYGENVTRHGMFDRVDPKQKSSGEGDAPVRQCPECEIMMHAAVRQCEGCGYEFPEPSPNHGSQSHDGAVMSDQVESEWVTVDSVRYERWKKRDNPEGKPDTLRITYHCGLISVSEWLCPDHSGYARQKYVERMYLLNSTAQNLDECLMECDDWRTPGRIKVRPDGRFHEIVQLDYLTPGPIPYGREDDDKDWSRELEDEIPF